MKIANRIQTLKCTALLFLFVLSLYFAHGRTLAQDNTNQIVLPTAGRVTVNFVRTSASCTGDFGLRSPDQQLIFSNYLYYAGLPYPIPEHFEANTELVFYLKPGSFCLGGPYLSTDPARARITQPDSNTWLIAWEDYTDGDFNDLVVRIEFQPAPVPIFELPYNYRGSTFVFESRDTEQGGRVNSYFDHQYPTYCDSPNVGGCASTDTHAVNFHGYDGADSTNQPPYRVVYNGHDGIDFAIPEGRAVLSAAPGTVIYRDNDDCTGNTVRIRHENGYTTEYAHLSRFETDVAVGTEITRQSVDDMTAVVGYVGNTGSCTTNAHLHFEVFNPSGIQVDPYGWSPRNDAAWYGEEDPWRQYNAENGGADATSHYLWQHPLEATALVEPTASTTITSPSGTIAATFGADTYSAPLRAELAETLLSVEIPNYRTYSTFSLVAYTKESDVVTSLDSNVTITIYLSTTNRLEQTTASDSLTLHRWNALTSNWDVVDASWQPGTGYLQATTAEIGTFAFSNRMSNLYLPLISQ